MRKAFYKCERLYTKILVDVFGQNQKTFDKFCLRSDNSRENCRLIKGVLIDLITPSVSVDV